MLKRQYRLTSSRDYRDVYRKEKKAVGTCLVAYCAPNRQEYSRFGFTVSRKIGNAVVRNRAKRRMREVTRIHLEHMTGGMDVVLIARSAIVRVSFVKLEKEFLSLMKDCGLLK